MQTPGQHERREHKKRAGCGGKILHKSTKNHFFKFWVPKKYQILAQKSIKLALFCTLLPRFILHLSRPVVFLSGEPKPRNLTKIPKTKKRFFVSFWACLACQKIRTPIGFPVPIQAHICVFCSCFSNHPPEGED